MIQNLAVAALMCAGCVMLHFFGLAALSAVIRRVYGRHRPRRLLVQAGAMLALAMGLLAVHSAEIWAYAFAYLALGALHTLDDALYFSVTTYSTLGYGDVVLHANWRLLGATQGVVGLLMFGWSVAFMVASARHLPVFTEPHPN